jgi:antitoxin component of MazEF toxin-antitoxin module
VIFLEEEKTLDLPLRRIGNTSLGVVIPKRVLDELGIRERDFVRIIIKTKKYE